MTAPDRPADPAAFDLFTIGHSNHPIDRFMTLLDGVGVTAIIDVRSLPSSRRYPWFSATRLKNQLAEAGIPYLPMGDALGGRPRDDALYRDGVADYAAMARTPEFLAGIDQVIATSKGARCCLMCAEREPLECHRCLLVAPALVARGLQVGHILGDGSILPHAEIEERLLADTDDLFAGDRSERLAQAYSRRAGAVAYRARR